MSKYICEKGEKQYEACKIHDADYCADCPHGIINEITREDYILTNINSEGYFVIRLKDDKEYIVYYRKLKGKTINYIKKDGKEIPLSNEVLKMYLASVREYQREGI